MAELARKKKIRGGHRASATRMVTQVLDAIEHPDNPESTLTKLKQCKAALEEKLDTVKQLDADILDEVDETDVENEIDQADVFKEKVQREIIDATSAITAKGVPVRGHSSIVTPPPSPTLPTATTRVKLPKLSLKRFNGDLTKWSTFWDSFESSIHQNSDLSSIDKFAYLTSLVEGSAAEAISGLRITATNYDGAIAILQKRFGDKKQIIAKHMDTLINLDAVASQNNIKALRQLYDSIEAQVRGLKALGIESDSYGSLLSSVLMNKLLPKLRLIVSHEVKDRQWELDELMRIIEGEIEARERASGTNAKFNKMPVRAPPPTTAALMAGGGASIVSCCFCCQSHASASCSTVSDVAERKLVLRRSGRCFVCLKKYHMSRDCRSRLRCSNCNGRHHVSICSETSRPINRVPKAPVDSGLTTHDWARNPPAPQTAPPSGNSTSNFTSDTASLYCGSLKTPVLLQTAKAQVFRPDHPQGTRNVQLIFDSGSQRSYITDKLKEALSLRPRQAKSMIIKTFGSSKGERQLCDVVSIGLYTKNESMIELSLLSVPSICEPLSCQPVIHASKTFQYLSRLDLADHCSEEDCLEIDILIGCDHYWKLVTGQTLREADGPVAVNTKLGWVLSGPVHGLLCTATPVNLVTTHTLLVDVYTVDDSLQELDRTLKKFWDLESLGVKQNEPSVYQDFQKDITFRDGRYEVSLPWKQSHPTLPGHYELALKRLGGLLKCLRHTPRVLCQYDAVIKDQLSRGIIEPVDEFKAPSHQVHYLPHHAVIRSDKETTKLRVVYDASARTDGPALNDCLYTGPKFGQKIMDIIVRFRSHKVALVADIEKAFLMVSVCPKDRDALRFLWVDSVNERTPKVLTFRFSRVVFGVSSSPFLLNATIRHHLEKYNDVHPEFVQRFLRSVYVDDVSFGADCDDDAYELYLRSKQILSEGGFNLRKFITNSANLQQKMNMKESHSTVDAEGGPVKEEDKTYTKHL